MLPESFPPEISSQSERAGGKPPSPSGSPSLQSRCRVCDVRGSASLGVSRLRRNERFGSVTPVREPKT
jgi:hypothetical protein